MASLTLKGIPETLMERLRVVADKERRSLNQQAILILERALAGPRPTFSEAFDAFLTQEGASPLEPSDLDNLRSKDTGRSVEL